MALEELIYANADCLTISRRSIRGKWAYYSADGERIEDRDEITRLNAVGLPPAYINAAYAPFGHSHILAIGYDAKGRKQYRYHAHFSAQQSCSKFDNCRSFGAQLALLRRRVDRDLAHPGLGKSRVLASIVRLLDTGSIRIGNEVYAKTNRSFGATTLRRRHVQIKGATLHLHFRAKSGLDRNLRITDRRLARFVKRLQDLPGQALFKYVDDSGQPMPVNSTDVNIYIKETMGNPFTAKDFRTWSASVNAFRSIRTAKSDLSLKEMLAHVSAHLGNTPSIARKSYIHPAILSSMSDQAAIRAVPLPRATRWLDRYDRGLLAFLDKCPSAADLLIPA